ARAGGRGGLLRPPPLSAMAPLAGTRRPAAIPFAVLSTVLMAGAAFWLGFSFLGALYGWFGIQLLGMGMLALSLAFGVPWARLDWDDPRRMGSGWGALLSTASSGLLGLVVG